MICMSGAPADRRGRPIFAGGLIHSLMLGMGVALQDRGVKDLLLFNRLHIQVYDIQTLETF